MADFTKSECSKVLPWSQLRWQRVPHIRTVYQVSVFVTSSQANDYCHVFTRPSSPSWYYHIKLAPLQFMRRRVWECSHPNFHFLYPATRFMSL